MLRIAACLLVSVLALAPAAPRPASATILPGRHGDANCDEAINPLDTSAILHEVAGIDPGAPCEDRADVDCDGHISGEDALRILRWFVGVPMPHLISCPEVGDPIL
jgi:hypothetical protein